MFVPFSTLLFVGQRMSTWFRENQILFECNVEYVCVFVCKIFLIVFGRIMFFDTVLLACTSATAFGLRPVSINFQLSYCNLHYNNFLITIYITYINFTLHKCRAKIIPECLLYTSYFNFLLTCIQRFNMELPYSEFKIGLEHYRIHRALSRACQPSHIGCFYF